MILPTLAIRAGAVSLILLNAGGCNRQPTPAPVSSGAPNAQPAPDRVYTVRGVVTSLPDPAKPASTFSVRHEAIHDFYNAKGELVGMNSMEMPFPPAEGVSLEGIQIGDVVEVTFAHWWAGNRWRATRVTKLPPETSLTFGKADPAPPVQGGSDSNK